MVGEKEEKLRERERETERETERERERERQRESNGNADKVAEDYLVIEMRSYLTEI